MEKIYKPEIGWVFWAHLILILVVLCPLLMIWALTRRTGGIPIVILVILVLVVVITLLVLARTMYSLDYEKLTVKGAFKKREVLYGTVNKIVNTNRGLEFGEGMFVLSSDRIRVFYGEGKKVSISPREKPDALKTLREKCPSAVYEEDLNFKAAMEAKEAKPAKKDK